ncbi:MAG TPA: tetratricopeptide repeat protein [Candidatus Limnocylindrales bacterium]|nr:tetratricopeptide repeat protein [Candidatus Limnocylindrales bacterium]
MAASDRFDRKELKEPDPFFEAFGSARQYVDRNRTQVFGSAAAIVAVIALIAGVTGYLSSSRSSAATDFNSAVSNLEFDSPSAADASLSRVGDRANAGPYASLAVLYRANLAADGGRYDEAIKLYDEFIPNAETDYLEQIGLMGKAYALEQAGRPAEAAPVLDRAAEIEGPYRKAALNDRARIAEKAGDKAAAIAALQKLLEIEGSGAPGAAIERRIEALKAS